MSDNLRSFFENYFGFVDKVIQYHLNQLRYIKLPPVNKEFYRLKRFIDTAKNFLSDIDVNVIEGLAGKLYIDINSLYALFLEFKRKTRFPENIFYQEYLETIPEYKKLKSDIRNYETLISKYTTISKENEMLLKAYKDIPKDEKELKRYKKIKKEYVDAIYYIGYYKEKLEDSNKKLKDIEKNEKEEFLKNFEKYKNLYIDKFIEIINKKMFIFDKVLWENDKKSANIKNFFETSQIKGDFSTRTFINYFLKHIDIAKTKDPGWINYLKEMLKVIN